MTGFVFLKKIKSSSLVKGASVYIFSSVLNASIPFILLPVLTRHLAPGEYGQVAMFLVWVSLISALCGLSVQGAANRKYFDYDDPDSNIGEFVGACVYLLLISSLVFAAILLPLTPFISALLGIQMKWLWVGLLVAVCNFLIQLRLGQWQVRKKAIAYGSFQVSRSLIDMFLSIFLVVLLSFGVFGRLGGIALAAFLFGLMAIVSLRTSGLVKFKLRLDLMKEAFNFGFPLIPHILGAFLLITADRAIIGAVLGLDSAGYYLVAAQIAMILGLILDAFNKAYSPWLFEKLKRNQHNEKILVVKFSYGYIAFLLLMGLLGGAVSGKLLILMAGEEYAPSTSIVGWLFLAQSFRGIYFLFTNYIFFSKKTHILAKVTIVTGLLHVGLLMFMINLKGLEGAGISLCISMFFQMVVTAWVSNRLVPMPWGVKSVFYKTPK